MTPRSDPPLNGHVKHLVSDLVGLGLFDNAKIGFTNGRLAYDDVTARTCVAIEIGSLRRHINNNIVEEFYRSDQPFSPSTLSGVRRSAAELLGQIDRSRFRLKFNKGTLQTWLTYCHWAPAVSGRPPADLLATFEEGRLLVKRGEAPTSGTSGAVTEILRLYDDRASYRVTDVSSVLMRDLAIHLFSGAVYGTSGYLGTEELLAKLEHDPGSGQLIVTEYLNQASWGDMSMGSGMHP